MFAWCWNLLSNSFMPPTFPGVIGFYTTPRSLPTALPSSNTSFLANIVNSNLHTLRLITTCTAILLMRRLRCPLVPGSWRADGHDLGSVRSPESQNLWLASHTQPPQHKSKPDQEKNCRLSSLSPLLRAIRGSRPSVLLLPCRCWGLVAPPDHATPWGCLQALVPLHASNHA